MNGLKLKINKHDNYWMHHALKLAKKAAQIGEVPVGAVVICNGEIIGEGYNSPITSSNPTAHAEIMAIEQAAKFLNNYRLTGCELYVTIEPCMMCAGAIIHSRIERVVYGAHEPKSGALVSRLDLLSLLFINHKPEIVGPVLEAECKAEIQSFFRLKRNKRRKKIPGDI